MFKKYNLSSRSTFSRYKYSKNKKKYWDINPVKFYKSTLKKLSDKKKTLLQYVQLRNLIEFAIKNRIIPMKPPVILSNKRLVELTFREKIIGKNKLSKLREYMIYE